MNSDELLSFKAEERVFKPLSKFQSTWLDISMMVPTNVTVEQLTALIKESDKKIFEVELVDIFKKNEWKDEKSITIRFGMCDESQTLSKEIIDNGYESAVNAVKKCEQQLDESNRWSMVSNVSILGDFFN